MIQRPLTMTVICRTCENQYGAWRPQCPACATVTPQPVRDEQPINRPRLKRVHTDECIFCHRTKAKEICAHCHEPIHSVCRGVHEGDCAVFQVVRQQEIERLTVVAANA